MGIAIVIACIAFILGLVGVIIHIKNHRRLNRICKKYNIK